MRLCQPGHSLLSLYGLIAGALFLGLPSLEAEVPKPFTISSGSQAQRADALRLATADTLEDAAVPRAELSLTTNRAETTVVSSNAEPDSLLRKPGLVFPELVSTNLRPVTPDPEQARQLQAYQEQLEQGRKHRKAGNFAHARQVLERIMATPAPAEFHRCALLELGLLAQDQNQLAQAQQIYAQYVNVFGEDPSVPEVLLRQGLLYRQMGARELALSKFFSVMSAALSLKVDRLAYYQRMVLQAKTEIADTYYFDGQYKEAADYFNRLLKLEEPQLNRELIHYKLVRCYAGAQEPGKTLSQAQLFAELYPESGCLAEVRFLQADALKALGRKEEAVKLVLALVQSQRATADANQSNWAYWQQRTGNELANQLYQQGDFVNALELYSRLGQLGGDPGWRAQALYQAALIYERLDQPEKADEMYVKILETGKDLDEDHQTAALNMILQMAQWRKKRLEWQTGAELYTRQLTKLKNAGETTSP